jgi:hypothetical protein
MTDWDQLINDTGYELFFYEQQLVGGALEIGGAARVIEARETDGWELLQVGYRHWGSDGKVQLCFRRPYPDRDERVAMLRQLRQELESRFDARYRVVDVVDPIGAGIEFPTSGVVR